MDMLRTPYTALDWNADTVRPRLPETTLLPYKRSWMLTYGESICSQNRRYLPTWVFCATFRTDIALENQ